MHFTVKIRFLSAPSSRALGAATRHAAGLCSGSLRGQQSCRSPSCLPRARGASRLTAGPNAETRSDHLSGLRIQSVTADILVVFFFFMNGHHYHCVLLICVDYDSKNINKDGSSFDILFYLQLKWQIIWQYWLQSLFTTCLIQHIITNKTDENKTQLVINRYPLKDEIGDMLYF